MVNKGRKRWSVLLLVPLVMSGMVLPATGKLTAQQRQEVVNAHNHFRRLEVTKRSAVGMRLMEWDTRLEEHATLHVGRCTFQHSTDGERGQYGKSGEFVGENIYRGGGKATDNLTRPVEYWHSEVKYFTFPPMGQQGTDNCAPTSVCGHYTQVVWGSTNRVGCDVKYCTGPGQGSHGRTYMVCNYAPQGNYAPVPYNRGSEPCGSNCPKMFPECVNKLCARVGSPGSGGSGQCSGSFVVLALCYALLAALI